MNIDDTCASCGAPTANVTELQVLPAGQWSAAVEVSFSRCDKCGEELLTPEQMRDCQLHAAAIVRAEQGIMPPDRIRDLRARYGLTAAELGRVLGAPDESVERWERGTVLPDAEKNAVLLALEQQPALMARRAGHAGVALRSPPSGA